MSYHRHGYEFNQDYSRPQQAPTEAEYTAKTFSWMVLGLILTFATAVLCGMTGITIYALVYIPYIHLIILISTLALSLSLSYGLQKLSVGMAKGLYVGLSLIYGFALSIWLFLFELSSIVFVFLATGLYFGVMAAYGHFTKRSLAGVRPILVSGLIFLIVCALLSFFFPGVSMIDRVICLVGIAVFLGFTAYDTQMIRNYYHYYSGMPSMLEKASIFAAFQLYLDFINLFLYLLRFLGKSNK